MVRNPLSRVCKSKYFAVKMYARITRSVELIDLERTKDQFRLIGRRYGKVVKINKDANLPSHGFISNQQSNPVIYFNVSESGSN